MNTRQHLTQSNNFSSFSFMSFFSFFSITNWTINVFSIFVFTTIRRFFEIQKKAEAETVRKEIESRVDFDTRKEKSSMTRRDSWFIIFNFRFCRRFCYLASTSFKFSKSISIINSKTNVRKESIAEVDWSQNWVSDMSNSPIRSNPRIKQKFLSDESNRVLAIVRRSNSIREIVRNLRLDKIR